MISTQVAANWPRGENITEWKRLVVYQKCVVHRNEAGKLVAGAGNLHGGQGRALDFAVTGPNLTLAPSDVRAACRATVGANQPVVSNAVEALDIRVVPMVEPGRAHRASTDEAGAVAAAHGRDGVAAVAPFTDRGPAHRRAPAWRSNFGRPTPSTRRAFRSCVCAMAWRFHAIDAMLSP